MAIFNKRAKFTKEQLFDHYLKRNSIIDILYTIVRVLSIIVQNLYCISSYLVLSWLVLLPVNWLRIDLYSRLENYLYNSLLFIVSSWSLAAGVTVVESGDEFKHLIEEPEKHYPSTMSKANNESRSKQNGSTATRNLSNNKRFFDDLLNSNNRNGFTTIKSNQHLADLNGLYASNKHRIKNQLVNGHANKSSNDRTNSPIMNGITNGFSKETMSNNNVSISGDCNHPYGEKGELTENQFGRSRDQDSMITAGETDSLLVCHNNNDIISEQNYITARDNSQKACKDVVRHNTNKLALSPCVLSNSNGSELNTLKINQAKPRILFLCNHISTADVPLIMQSFSTLTNQSILWVLDAQFKATNFGIVCGSHGDYFVAKNSFVDGSLREHVLRYADRNLLVLFPEGGFLRKRIEGSNRYANRNNLPLTKYVTHPRFGAFKDLIDPSVGVTHIVDATLMYDNIKNPLSILDILFGNKKEPAILHYKVYERSEINPTEEWLRNIWLEKDKLLAKYYEDRASILKKFGDTLRVASLDWFKILSVHLFFFLVCYLTMFRLFNATSVTMLKARELYYSNI